MRGEQGTGGARPQRMKTRKFETGRKGAGDGKGVEKTYVANEKLGAGVFEGNMTTI
jgi:hypothetical protein